MSTPLQIDRYFLIKEEIWVSLLHDFLLGTPISTKDEDDKGPVAGDISPDGTEVLIKYKEEVYYWKWNVSNI